MVRLGHDGWTGEIARDLTADALIRIARNAAYVMVREFPEDARLVVAHDRKFLSDRFAADIARELATLGIEICLIPRAVSPAVAAFAIGQVEAIGGIMVSGGNHPADVSGLKLRSWDGGAIPRWMIAQIEEMNSRGASISRFGPTARLFSFDPLDDYLRQIGRFVDAHRIRASGVTAVIDSHWGTGSGLLPRLTDGGGSRSVEIRSTHNPLFPELTSLYPRDRNLERVQRMVRTGDAELGLALSADATVLGLIDERGHLISPGTIASVIGWYFYFVRKEPGPAGRSIGASTAIDLIAADARAAVHELPYGFDARCEVLREQMPALVIDEDGGIALTDHQFDADAILAAMLVLSCLVQTGMQLSELVERVTEITGERALERVRIDLSPEQTERVRSIFERGVWPQQFAGEHVTDVYGTDGTRFQFGEDSWLLIRHDENDHVVDIVAESNSTSTSAQLVGAGRQLLFA
jgi:phosphomannomutase